jgi:hypothetical protein
MSPHQHRWLVRTLIGVAAVLGVIAVFAVWANRQLLDTGYWKTTNQKLIASPPIKEQLSVFLTDQLYANVDVGEELKKELPSELKPLASPAAGALRDVVQRAILFLLERPRVQELWGKANEVTHAQFVRLIENKGRFVKTGGGAVVLDLRPMLTEAADKVGVPVDVVQKIPENVAQVKIVTSSQLKTMQNAINLLRVLALALPLLVFALLALAVYLARGRRVHELVTVGAALIGVGLVVVVARGLIGNKVVDSLATTEAVKPAAQAAWSIGTSVLADVAWSTVFIGAVVIFAGLLAGHTRVATSARRSMAPYLRDRADLSFGAVGLLLLLLFAWGPIPATRTWLGLLIIIALAFFGAEMLRRQTAREFPDAHLRPGMFGAPHVAVATTPGAPPPAPLSDGTPPPTSASKPTPPHDGSPPPTSVSAPTSPPKPPDRP